MSIRGPIARLVFAVVALGAGALAIAGGLELHGPGLIAVTVAGALAGCLALGIAREAPGADRRSSTDAAVQTAGCTIGALLVLSGLALVLGGVAAALGGVGLVVGLMLYALVRVTRAGRVADPAGAPPGRDAAHVVRLDTAAEAVGPVRDLTTQELGQEWLRTGRLLAGGLRPAVRVAVVRRRQEALDELELRDPAGFARWLAAGSTASDPADFVHGEWTAGTDAA